MCIIILQKSGTDSSLEYVISYFLFINKKYTLTVVAVVVSRGPVDGCGGALVLTAMVAVAVAVAVAVVVVVDKGAMRADCMRR